ncbi:MAG TPA: cyclopropane-fatty-acyl-phospholipid synthase family protein [Gemmatimonadaceae bacterium]|nr:cyclopropane-fatty-acyl-phospholipid synthase family protein [Gemmatimonadaceae bacterium]
MATASRTHVHVARRVAAAIFGEPAERSFAVRYWDGSVEAGDRDAPPFTVVIRDASALRNMLLPPSEISIAESFMSGAIDVEGDLEAAVELGDGVGQRVKRPAVVAQLIPLLLRLPRPPAGSVRSLRFVRPDDRAGPSRSGDAAAIRHHYDVSNAFYALWLDSGMQYTCAYFGDASERLEQAQLDKLEHICRKLRLQPGERLLDIGCGWGGLVRYAASRYGVTAHGITLSAAQAEYAQSRIAAEGLTRLCRVEVRDYRDLASPASYDKIVAVGVTEHVAADAQPCYFAAAHRVLEPGGLFLNHCEVSVARARPRTLRQRISDRLWRRNEFIEKYVFPDARLVPAAHVIASAEQVGFELRDVESLREHYAMTLRHWLRHLEAQERKAIELVGEHTYRLWRLYMSTGAAGFSSGRINIIQTLLAKPDASGRARLPLTREDLYGVRRTTLSGERIPAA